MGIKIFFFFCQFDARQSFYSKAKVIEKPKTIVLISYNTEVAVINRTKKELKILKSEFVNSDGKYSQTTTRHIREFALQYGFGRLDVVRVGKYKRLYAYS